LVKAHTFVIRYRELEIRFHLFGLLRIYDTPAILTGDGPKTVSAGFTVRNG